MLDIETGTLLTFPLHGSVCALAHVVHIEDLPLGRYYHLAVLDALLEAGPEGYTDRGEYLPRTHEMENEDQASQLLDHLAFTEDGLLASAPIVVGWREVEHDDARGYRTWATLFGQEAERRGLLGTRQEEPEEEIDEEMSDDEGEEIEEKNEGDTVAASEAEESEEGVQVEVRPWHRTVFADPFDAVLLGLVDEFRNDESLRGSVVGGFITGLYSEDRTAELEELVNRMAEGDFSASQELAMFGDAAIPPLEARISRDADPQFVEDALLAMTTIGTERALGAIASTFDALAGSGTPLSNAVERGYLNALTMTGGTGDPALDRARIERVTDPSLADDLRTARAAVEEARSEK